MKLVKNERFSKNTLINRRDKVYWIPELKEREVRLKVVGEKNQWIESFGVSKSSSEALNLEIENFDSSKWRRPTFARSSAIVYSSNLTSGTSVPLSLSFRFAKPKQCRNLTKSKLLCHFRIKVRDVRLMIQQNRSMGFYGFHESLHENLYTLLVLAY
ncbi:hypothetical protein M0802_000170 [Mischocyttarus mexicanus]|nr:hypothetical protein M0802_000170 [Mischocyttarus mexicanus]